MFVHLSNAQTIRAAATIPLATTIEGSHLIDVDAGGLSGVFVTTGWTAGTCTMQAQGSVDGTTWFDLPADHAVTISGNGVAYLPFLRAIPKYVRFTATPGGGFDGVVRVDLRSDSALPSN